MSEQISGLVDLPLDILVLIFPYLDAKSFLALCRTCKAFQQSSIRLDPTYWRHATQTTFRVPNQPLVQADGERWQKMYRRLLTQSRAFTWGKNGQNRLGHSSERREVTTGPMMRQPMRRRWVNESTVSFPTEMEQTRELGIIADMQCGGWSTTLLTSRGQLYTAGVLNGMEFNVDYSTDGPQPLKFPPGFPQADAKYEEPSVAIRQFSSGRSHILGLADSGRIWSWYAAHKPALHIKFLHVDIHEASSVMDVSEYSTTEARRNGNVREVVAGWGHSSAYIHGTGIILWNPAQRPHDEPEIDSMLVIESVVLPKTGYQRVAGSVRESAEEKALGKEVGAVIRYIILEHFVVFATDIGKVFATNIDQPWDTIHEIMELRALRNDTGVPCDVQGSFRSFAVFKAKGEVITTNQDYLQTCWDHRNEASDQADSPALQRIPALQNNDVISVAFGDYHFLALHSTGKITSYGTELQGCGALGLGGDGDPEGRTRGIRYVGFSHDGKLLPHAYTHGRQVWFEPEKKKWITFMTSGGKDPEEAKERMRMFVTDASVQGEVSEWFEQEGRDWDKAPELKDADEDGLGAYFALRVTAAGWHSGALVLVNETLANGIRDHCITEDPTTVEEPDQEQGESSQPAGPSSYIGSTLQWISNAARGFLGLPPADAQPGNLQRVLDRHDQQGADLPFIDPISHGASPGRGYKYTWAEHSFPRLKLSDGREMPGEMPFNAWRYGRPEWQLDVDIS